MSWIARPYKFVKRNNLEVSFYGWRRRRGRTLPTPSAGSAHAATSRAPKWAFQTAYQLIRHSNAAQGLGLWYRRDANFILESVSDASFAPGGAHSHGCVITTVAGAPAWKSCKQPFPALSTAEAELIEVIEAVVVGDSIACLVAEMARDVPVQSSSSATTLLQFQ